VILDVNSLNIELMIRNSKNHLNEVNETYLKHMAVNFKIGLSTLVTGFKFLIHGIVPALFKKKQRR
jgi:hypothetical protein